MLAGQSIADLTDEITQNHFARAMDLLAQACDIASELDFEHARMIPERLPLISGVR